MAEPKSTVMVVEDTDALRRLEGYVLRKAGVDVVEMADGQEAWEALQESRPDLVLLDVRMPRMDGLELLQRMRATEGLRDLPVVMVTSLGTEADIAFAESFGISAYLV